MTIIVFLIDTSASMFQRTYIGGRTTLLDVAKSAVETFVKIRQRSIDSRIDRYMLLTFEETPNNIKAGWKENLATFMNELKNLQCYSMTTMGVAVKQAFDILNINRMSSGIDTYGQGRCPFFLETSVIVLITDGGKLTTVNGVQEEFTLPMHSPIPGSEMTREPFRWDQRLFTLVLRLTGTPAIERDTGLVPSDSSPIDAMCEVTGGRSYCITSHRMLNQCIDSLVQKLRLQVQNGVVINFEKIGPDPPPPQFDKNDDIIKDDLLIVGGGLNKDGNVSNEFGGLIDDRLNQPLLNTSWHNCRKMIYVPKSNKSYCVGFWPIPESFWPEVTASVLPARSAHPNIKFTCTSSEPLVIENLPFDKYELEPSPLTQYILSRKQPKTCWQVFVANSYKNSEVGHPFGYLKASTNLNCVNLFVMPYNYPVLLPLLDELSKIHRWKPTNEWRTQFQNYMRTLPAYYAGSLRRALTRMGTPLALAQTLIPENSENLSYSVSNYLKRLKNQAKAEYEKLCAEIIQRQTNANTLKTNFNNSEQIRVLPRVTLNKKELISQPLLADKFNAQRDLLMDQINPFIVTVDVKERQTVSFKNPFDIPRNRLIEQVVRMRNNFLQSDWITLDQDSAHSLPICQMGNYQEYLKRQTPQLREIESAPVRQHMFGNPFKIDKRMMVDEADCIDLVVGSSGGGATQPTTNISTNSSSSNNSNVTISSNGANRSSNKRALGNSDGVLTMTSRLPPLKQRKPGPLPKNFVIRRPNSPAPLILSSPVVIPTTTTIPLVIAPTTTTTTTVIGSTATTISGTTGLSLLAPSPVPWLNSFVDNSNNNSFDDRNNITNTISNNNNNVMNGLDNSINNNNLLVSSSSPIIINSERSRSPSPTATTPIEYPSYSVNSGDDNNSFVQQRHLVTATPYNSNNYGGSTLINNTVLPTNNFSDFYLNNNNNNNVGGDGDAVNIPPVTNSGDNSGVTTPIIASVVTDDNNIYDDLVGVGGGGGVVISEDSIKQNISQILKETTIFGGINSSCDNKLVVIEEEDRQEIDNQNWEIRKQLNRLVRRPGKNFTELFDNIKTLKGDIDVQIEIVKLIIKESLRFKRQNLASLLEEHIQNLQSIVEN